LGRKITTMDEAIAKIYTALDILENKREKFSKSKFLRFCNITKKEVLTAFEERKLSKDETKVLLRRINNLLDIPNSKEMERDIPLVTDTGSKKSRICPKCGMKVRVGARFCKRCGHQLG
jgi:hypothetical protein